MDKRTAPAFLQQERWEMLHREEQQRQPEPQIDDRWWVTATDTAGQTTWFGEIDAKPFSNWVDANLTYGKLITDRRFVHVRMLAPVQEWDRDPPRPLCRFCAQPLHFFATRWLDPANSDSCPANKGMHHEPEEAP